jgi:peptidoglycan/xylan/chitin deacetylase (PgdA/CDA1 family)
MKQQLMNLITPLSRHFYNWMQRRHPGALWHGDETRREIALTFDDGPHPRDTPRLLDVLARHQVRATFHIVGKSAERHPELVRQIHAHGHQLALHCYRHIPFPLENEALLRRQLDRTRNVIAAACGIPPQTIKDLRPPYGMFSARNLSLLMEWGYRLVLWNRMPPHWMQPVSWSLRQLHNSLVPGALIVLHDGHGHGARVAEIVDLIVPRATTLGLEFVTVEQMWQQRGQPPASP